jgi:hypothetical protein
VNICIPPARGRKHKKTHPAVGWVAFSQKPNFNFFIFSLDWVKVINNTANTADFEISQTIK